MGSRRCVRNIYIVLFCVTFVAAIFSIFSSQAVYAATYPQNESCHITEDNPAPPPNNTAPQSYAGTVNNTVQCCYSNQCFACNTNVNGNINLLLGGQAPGPFTIQCDTSGLSSPVGISTITSPESNITSLGGILLVVRNGIFTIIGIFVIGLVCFAGFTYMTAAGDPDKSKKAILIIVYTFVGLGIIAFAIIIIRVVTALLGINISPVL